MTNSEKLILTSVPYVGTKEDPNGYNEIIKNWIEKSCKSLGIKNPQDDSAFAWCGCFISNMLIESGIWPNDRMHIVSARAFLNIGETVLKPQLGDLVILERGPGKGHIGIYLSESTFKYRLLSGNSSDSVSIQDFDKGRTLGIRRI